MKTKEIEIWVEVPSLFGFYAVNRNGEVKRVGRWMSNKLGVAAFYKERVLKLRVDGGGYLGFTASINDFQRTIHTHRVVAECFLKAKGGVRVVNHIDGNKLNNKPENLEWVSPSENTRHAVKNGLTGKNGSRSGSSKLNKEKVLLIREMYEFSEECGNGRFEKPFTANWLAKCFKVTPPNIRNIIKKETWQHV